MSLCTPDTEQGSAGWTCPPSTRRARVCAALLGPLLLGGAGAAAAAVYAVDRFDDVATATGCALLTPNDCSLRGAIIKANLSAGDDVVAVQAGTYLLTIPGADEELCATGDLDITDAVTVSGPGSAASVVDASGLGDRVFHVNAAGLTVLLSGLTVTGGSTLASGGGGYHEAGDLTLADVVVTGNHAAQHGGGVYADLAELSVQDGSVISDNSAGMEWPYRGGGLAAGTLVVTDSTVVGNQAYYGAGIASAPASGGSLTVKGSTVASNNGAIEGGGIYAHNVELELSNSTVVGNAAANGGGLSLTYGNGTPTMHSSTCSGNTASNGSALLLTLSNLSVTNTVLVGTCAVDGGAVLSNGGNLESPGDGCALSGPGDQVNVADPALAPLADYGGATWTMLPRLGSPVVGGGSNAFCLALDQRGEPRGDGDCDAGAVERQATEPAVLFADGFESGTTSVWSAGVP